MLLKIKATVDIPPQLKTVGHVPREISRHIFFFLKEENAKVEYFVYSTQYEPSPIPAGGLEIPLKSFVLARLTKKVTKKHELEISTLDKIFVGQM